MGIITTGASEVTTAGDAISLISLLLQMDRPDTEVLAALDRHASLLPPGYDRVRTHVAAGNRGAAGMAMQIALDPRPR